MPRKSCSPATPENLEQCKVELEVFCQGGLPGKAQLQLVLPAIFRHYEIVDFDEQKQLLSAAGLKPFIKVFAEGNKKPRVSFWVDPE